MVRLIAIEIRGKVLWTEDAPTHCSAEHEALLPKWLPCEVCSFACRHWQCQECLELLRDYDHVCRGRRPADPPAPTVPGLPPSDRA